MLAGEQSVWYPSVRLFRQTDRGEWSDVFNKVHAELSDWLKKRPVPDCIEHSTPPLRGGSAMESRGTISVPSPHISPTLRLWSDLPTVFDQAVREYRAGETGRAEQLCQEILQHSPRHIEALRLSATIARQSDRADDAIRMLTRAVAAQDNDPQLQWELGGALQSAGRFDEAAACFERAIALRPEFAKAHNALGGIYMETHRYEDAIAAFRRAAELQPDYMAAHNNLGLALAKQGRHAESLACFRRAAELAPESILVARNLKEATLARRPSERGDTITVIPLARASG